MARVAMTKLVANKTGKDSRLYAIRNNRKQWVVNEEGLRNLGFDWGDVKDIDAKSLAKLPTDIPLTSTTQKVYDTDDYIYCIEKTWSDNFNIGIIGWAVGKKKPVKTLIIDIDGKQRKVTDWIPRPEIFEYFSKNTKFPVMKACGFSLIINRTKTQEFKFTANSVSSKLDYAPALYKYAGVSIGKDLEQRFRDIVNGNKLSVLEVGSRVSPGGTNKRVHFKKAGQYVGFDYHPGKLVDVVGDAHELSKHFNQKFDALFSDSVLEHLAAPWKAVIEMNKVLKKGGYVYHSVPSTWPLHDMPWDFWRFSDAGLKSLFSEAFGFKVIDVEYLKDVHIHMHGETDDAFSQTPLSPSFGFVSILAQKVKNIDRLQTRFNHGLDKIVDKGTAYPLWDA